MTLCLGTWEMGDWTLLQDIHRALDCGRSWGLDAVVLLRVVCSTPYSELITLLFSALPLAWFLEIQAYICALVGYLQEPEPDPDELMDAYNCTMHSSKVFQMGLVQGPSSREFLSLRKSRSRGESR